MAANMIESLVDCKLIAGICFRNSSQRAEMVSLVRRNCFVRNPVRPGISGAGPALRFSRNPAKNAPVGFLESCRGHPAFSTRGPSRVCNRRASLGQAIIGDQGARRATRSMPHDLSLRCRSPCHRRDDDGGGGHRAGADAAVTAMVNSHGHPNVRGQGILVRSVVW
jgi:hypothetical protein